MPCDLGRILASREKLEDRRRRVAFERSADQKILKECQIPGLPSRSSEHKWMCIVSSQYVYYILPPSSPTLHEADQISQSLYNIVGLKTLPSPQPVISNADPLENNTDSSYLLSSGQSSGAFISDQYGKKNSLAISQSSSSISLSSSMASGNSFSAVNSNISLDDSDFLVKDTPKVDKRVKKNSRKKGKKKGKQYKRTKSRKVSIESDAQDDNSIFPVSGNSEDKKLTSDADKAISDDNIESKRMPSTFLDRDCTEEKDESENNNEFVDCSTTSVSCASYSAEIDASEESEQPTSNERLVDEGYKCCNITHQGNPTVADVSKTMLPTFVAKIKNLHLKVDTKFDDSPFSSSINTSSASLADSLHDGWNSDISADSSEDMDMVSTVLKESQLPKSLDGKIISDLKNIDPSCGTITDSCHMITEVSEENCAGNPYWLNDVLDTCSILERAEYSSQASSSDDFHPVVYGKRSRRARKISGNGSFNSNRKSSAVARDSRAGTETKTSIFIPNDSIIVSSHDDRSSKASKAGAKRETCINQQDKSQSASGYSYTNDNHACTKGSKQLMNSFKSDQPPARYTLGSFFKNVKYTSNSVAKAKVMKQQFSNRSNDGMDRKNDTFNNYNIHHTAIESSPVNHKSKSNNSFEICGGTVSSQFAAATDDCTFSCEIATSKQEQELHIPVQNSTPLSNCVMTCDLEQLPTGSNSLDQILESEDPLSSADMCKDILVQDTDRNPFLKLEIASSIQGHDRPGQVPKLYHIERTSVVQDTVTLNCSKPSDNDETFSCIPDSNNSGLTLLDPKKSCVVSSQDNTVTYSKPSSTDVHYSSVDSVQSHLKLTSSPHSSHVAKFHDSLKFETDLNKITQAVVDAYRMQVVAEGVQKVTGSPIADFERFLFSASPVIGQIHYSRSCRVCCKEQLVGQSLCCHEMSSFCLGSVWQWYEEPGCFGLEVKALKNQKSKRSSDNTLEFDAYFVPYLSAVQLFGNSKSSRCCKSIEEAAKCSEVQKKPNSLASLPIFSMLLPQPSKEVDQFLSGLLSSSGRDELSDQPTKSYNIDGELLFEYFESAQPPWRRPLFDKIKELVSGHSEAKSQPFGDPGMLESLNLHDLHPASWYSVAWYPICRIPDDNLRAAFLTYHSLGNCINQNASSTGVFQNAVCPVVGLQSYNDKGESWFQLRVPDSEVFESDKALYNRPSVIMRQRLRTLKEAASMMATAAVSKNNKRSVNRHPDYDFFMSRSR